ncbi:DUF1579 domain-containing protein [Longimicrobium sp.]|uniref:DUF1579 domain-containing protein n=1 Tax=Longimicrobium sp. TaxID=2029185 RepID=UPI002E341C14|nr:DUF1579 domain-containing protein [Longimicrobium sp.]HEX6041936.1 DUF1579 domain-containing protein [Longimicrobium sp.]
MSEPTTEQRWLQRLAGEWTYEMEAEGGPGEPSIRETGTERGRSLGDTWVMCESVMPDGIPVTNVMTLGYDPARGRIVGTFVSSMMTHLWVYAGTLEGDLLTLETEGPGYPDAGRTVPYRDTIQMVSDDHRVHTSSVRQDDGEWHTFMTTHYRRTG